MDSIMLRDLNPIFSQTRDLISQIAHIISGIRVNVQEKRRYLKNA